MIGSGSLSFSNYGAATGKQSAYVFGVMQHGFQGHRAGKQLNQNRSALQMEQTSKEYFSQIDSKQHPWVTFIFVDHDCRGMVPCTPTLITNGRIGARTRSFNIPYRPENLRWYILRALV